MQTFVIWPDISGVLRAFSTWDRLPMFTNNHNQRVASSAHQTSHPAYLDCLLYEPYPYPPKDELSAQCCVSRSFCRYILQRELLPKVCKRRAQLGSRTAGTLWADLPQWCNSFISWLCFHASLFFYFQPRMPDWQSLTHSFSFIRSLDSSLGHFCISFMLIGMVCLCLTTLNLSVLSCSTCLPLPPYACSLYTNDLTKCPNLDLSFLPVAVCLSARQHVCVYLSPCFLDAVVLPVCLFVRGSLWGERHTQKNPLEIKFSSTKATSKASVFISWPTVK